MQKPKVGFVSLGCPKNQVDTEVMLGLLDVAGFELTAEDIEADIVVVNTCAFIESAKQESIDNILDIAWLKKNANLKGIVVTGCLAERYRDEIFTELPEVDAVLGTGSYHDIVAAIEAVARGEKFSAYRDKNDAPLGGERILTTPDYYAYLKLAEGCNNHCTYCAIPSIRGKLRSREMDELVDEAKALAASGVKELVLVAQDTTRYGEDLYGEPKLAELLHRLGAETDIPWLRVLYCYPDRITDALIAEIRQNPKVVKYIDMPIQHISDSVLRRMNRHGDGALIRSVVAKLRAEIPNLTLRTTAICGFPGETEEDYAELCAFIDEAKFEKFGCFPYSREEGTPAAALPDQIDEQVKQDRADRLMQMQLDIVTAQNEKMVGKKLTVLCEGFDPVSEMHFGRAATDAPEIDGKLFFAAARRVEPGTFVKVRITEVQDYDLVGVKL